jgi:positive phototaxis protein PixI
MLTSPRQSSLSVSFGSNAIDIAKDFRKFLQFQLGTSDLALLEAELVTEIITVPKAEILPVPQMLYAVLGIYSWRSEMLWIVDLENLLGYPPILWESSESLIDNLMVMVVQLEGQSLGLVVPKVNDLIQQDIKEIKPTLSELFSEDLAPFLKGYFTNINNDILMFLNIEVIFGMFVKYSAE